MPFIHLLITKKVTRSQKQQLVKDFTESLVRVIKKKPEHIHIVIEEVDTDNWGFAGVLTTEYRKAGEPRAKRGSRGGKRVAKQP